MTLTKIQDLTCLDCKTNYGPESRQYNCAKCGGILEVSYNPEFLKETISIKTFQRDSHDLWKYFDLLPILRKESTITLNEGQTPLIATPRIEQQYGLKEFYLKDETRNPTCSFKDRPNAVGISKAREFGANTIAIASSGNAAASLSAYAAKAAMNCVVAVPAAVSQAKLTQILVFGAIVVKVNGSYSNSFNLITNACENYGWHNLTSVSSANPYQVEGDKTVAYEICEQLNWKTPDWVVIPLGAGPLLVGAFKGFKELQQLDLIKNLPKMLGVQAMGCAPIVKAYKENRKEVEAWGETKTIALSIADPLVGYERDGTLTLNSIRASHGCAESVTDKEMLDAVKLIARNQGIFAEPAAAATVAAVKKLKDAGTISSDESIVSLITGSGLKSPEIISDLNEPETIDGEIAQLERIIKKQ
ncbi:MAG TPA: threonine synthase [Candidatus Acidoferrum sp.]|nr:threonine synthase [Candidatus Acidoferrum sp.]